VARPIPITAKAEGSSYHLLQIVYKDFFGTQLKDTQYESQLKKRLDYEKLKEILKLLAVNNANNEQTYYRLVSWRPISASAFKA
jgi:hypothetical protein